MRFVVQRAGGVEWLTPFDATSGRWLEEQAHDEVCTLELVSKSATRSKAQNRLAFRWYKQIEEELFLEIGEAHSLCKLTVGIPILRRDNETFREWYDRAVKPLSWDQKLHDIEFVDVTSKFGVKQMTVYLETMQRKFAEQGVILDGAGELL